MRRTREQILDERRQLKNKYGELFDSVGALLSRVDPIGINFEINPDEYHPETGTILPRLGTCNSARDVQRVVHEEFVRWFGADDAGPEEKYKGIASAIWELWQGSRKEHELRS
jgi:hypothetical protein